MLACPAVVFPSDKQIVPYCLCGISIRQLELLLWKEGLTAHISLSMFAHYGFIE